MKNSTFKLKALSLLGLFSLSAHSGVSGLGNGGDVRICFNNSKDYDLVLQRLIENREKKIYRDALAGIDLNQAEVRLFDFVSLQKTGGIFGEAKEIELEIIEGSVKDIVNNRVDIFKNKTNYAETLREVLEGPLAPENWVPSESGVIEIDDSNHKANLPESCLLVQIAVQHDQGVHYDERLFSRLSLRDRAGLILHEAAYFLGKYIDKFYYKKEPSHQDSNHVRSFVAWLFTKGTSTLSAEELLGGLGQRKLNLGSDTVTYKNLKILGQWRRVVDLSIWSDGARSAIQKDREHGHINGVYLVDKQSLGNVQILQKHTFLGLDARGNLLSLKVRWGNSSKVPVFKYQGMVFEDGEFYADSGVLSAGDLVDKTIYQGVPLASAYVRFHPNGMLKSGTLSASHTFKQRIGRKTLHAGKTFTLNEAGLLVK